MCRKKKATKQGEQNTKVINAENMQEIPLKNPQILEEQIQNKQGQQKGTISISEKGQTSNTQKKLRNNNQKRRKHK